MFSGCGCLWDVWEGPWQYSCQVLTCLLQTGFQPGDLGEVDLSVLGAGSTHGWVWSVTTSVTADLSLTRICSDISIWGPLQMWYIWWPQHQSVAWTSFTIWICRSCIDVGRKGNTLWFDEITQPTEFNRLSCSCNTGAAAFLFCQ